MKIIAMYLPQFHTVKENNEWWGEGFTDWVSARNAIKLFENHYQPHIPFNEYYYDLLQKETMLWQANLMKQYGIDGACMYHYWFKDGRQILEKLGHTIRIESEVGKGTAVWIGFSMKQINVQD